MMINPEIEFIRICDCDTWESYEGESTVMTTENG